MRWDTIASVHKSSIVKSLALWFVISPLAARLLESPLLSDYTPFLSLPFNWRVFYTAALLFFVSGIVYALFCPAVIKNYEGSQDFFLKDGSFEKLSPLAADVLDRLSGEKRKVFLKRQAEVKALVFRDHNDRVVEPYDPAWVTTAENYRASLINARSSNDRLQDLYSGLREVAQYVNPGWRFLITFAHILGFVCLAYVLLQGAVSVYRPLFSGI